MYHMVELAAGQVLTSTGANSLPSWTIPNNLLQFDCSLFIKYNMFTGQSYLLSSLFNVVYVDQTNTPSMVYIILYRILEMVILCIFKEAEHIILVIR